MESKYSFVLVLFLLVWTFKVRSQQNVFNVLSFGAVPDGVSDNAKAFTLAWSVACASNGPSIVMVPNGKFLMGPVEFPGPCNGPINFLLQGGIVAPQYHPKDEVDDWIVFRNIDQLTINGGGSFDGQGSSAWPYNHCHENVHCRQLPTSLHLKSLTNSNINQITSLNPKKFHITISDTTNTILSTLQITAPETSPNTDGIHVKQSTNIQITNSIIGTGDDCISMGPGTKDVKISYVRCGPGHGISIGSLGGTPNEDDVVGVYVTNCEFVRTMNGVRIKTWAKGYTSNVEHVLFEGMRFVEVENPIVIDQQYCPSGHCKQGSSGVKIDDVRFNNIQGTSTSKITINFLCSDTNPCSNILVEDINIEYPGGSAYSCVNAYSIDNPRSCLFNPTGFGTSNPTGLGTTGIPGFEIQGGTTGTLGFKNGELGIYRLDYKWFCYWIIVNLIIVIMLFEVL